MNSEKADNQLNLATDISEEQREKSDELSAGFDKNNRTWDLIVRYYGDISELENVGAYIVYLASGYAIITISEEYIDVLESMPQIIYVEKPKNLFFSIIDGRRASCVSAVQMENAFGDNMTGLFGQGVICACIDSGIDYAHPVFRNEDGTTRILKIWDQSIQGNSPDGYRIGSEYDSEAINEALSADTPVERYRIVPTRDYSGHGTHVAGIMAGNFADDKNNNLGMATKSSIIAVKLGGGENNENVSRPLTSELMQAVNYIIDQAKVYGMPVAINLSYGNTYGSHDGLSLVETFINDVADEWKTVICVGSGNEGSVAGHASGVIRQNTDEIVQLTVGSYQQSFSIQIWKEYQDDIDIYLRGATGNEYVFINNTIGAARYIIDENYIEVYYGTPVPYSTSQEIYIQIIPMGSYVTEGIWQIELRGKKIADGKYDMWLPSAQVLGGSTRFVRPSSETTLTIPSTALGVITVGGYDSRSMSLADFSGRGYLRLANIVKPDLVAPAVNIRSAEPGGTTGVRTGTSMATPFVTGGAAMLMEWGIIRGRDSYLYGEKVKAYLIKGAKPFKGEEVPSPRQGWGALCVSDSIPR